VMAGYVEAPRRAEAVDEPPSCDGVGEAHAKPLSFYDIQVPGSQVAHLTPVDVAFKERNDAQNLRSALRGGGMSRCGISHGGAPN